MKKILITTIFALMFFVANIVSAQNITIDQTLTVDEPVIINQESIINDNVTDLSSGAQADYEREDVESEEDKLSVQNRNAKEIQNIVNTKSSLTGGNVGSRIRQQAKGVREKLMTTVNRKNTLKELRTTKLKNPEEMTRLEEERKQKIEETKAELRKQQGKSEIPTIGESYKAIFNKLNAIQVKIETSLPKIESSKKIDIEKAKEDLNNSRESLAKALVIIEELESIESGKEDDGHKASMISAKKELINSKKFLNSILVSLKQASKAKPIIQTGGGSSSDDNSDSEDSDASEDNAGNGNGNGNGGKK